MIDNTIELLRRDTKAGEGEREKRYEAEALRLQHFGTGIEMDCSQIPNPTGTVDKKK